MISALLKPLNIYALPFANSFIPEFRNEILNTLLAFSDIELRSLNKSILDEISVLIEKLLKRVFKPIAIAESMEKFSLSIALKLFRYA